MVSGVEKCVTRDLEPPYPFTVSWIVAPDFNARFLQNLPDGCCCPSAFPVQMKKEKAHVAQWPDKPSCVSEAHPVHLLAPAHQGLQGPDQVVRKLQEEAAL